MTSQVQYEWGLYVNTGDRTVDIVKSSYKGRMMTLEETLLSKQFPG